jgi:hypothetical protein
MADFNAGKFAEAGLDLLSIFFAAAYSYPYSDVLTTVFKSLA